MTNQAAKSKLITPGRMIPVLFFTILLILPAFIKNNYVTSVVVNCMVFAIFGLSWNIIGGYGAQISWCSAAFVAIGAYVNFIFNNELGVSPFLSMPIGLVLSLGMATLIGYGTFRLQGAYFSIATIAFAETLRSAIQYFKGLTKGAAGMYSTYRGNNFLSLSFSNDRPFYFIMLALLVLTLVFTYRFTISKTGWYLSCIKGDEVAANSLGIETFKVKLRAFQISAMMMTVAGCFYASFLSYISPASTCSFDLSIKIGVVAIIGGIGTLWGPVVGAFIIVPLIELAASLLGASGSSNVLYGLMLVLIVMFRPKGVFPLLKDLFDKLINRGNNQAKEAS